MSKTKLFTLLALLAVMAVPTFASAAQTVTVGEPRETAGPAAFVPGAKPPARARVSQCVSSPFSDGRRIVFVARMKMFTDTMGTGQKRQMRFDIYRKYNEQKRYKRIKAEGLSTWHEGGDPMAAIYQREVALAEPETAARFYAKVSFRWMSNDGKTVEWRRKLATKPCKMKNALPRLGVLAARHQAVAGTTDHAYTVTVSSRGGAEAENVPVHVSIDGAAPIVAIVDSVGPGQIIDTSFTGPACSSQMKVTIDPLRSLRMQFPRRPTVVVPC
jgi:hypothetical protein